ncbi:DUF4349 domain-containing protein [Sphingobacterium bovistauri]|uniref:DUF4349 domain-containing protein n=1 Tax=Sphingobacterium bovistauri TaxID=2781959 RepID=A0ABS7Z782_9SPHI|nr:DUF4349 domain-containing protein [Sphingobacterium bovistauri]MCA5005412.1 DUF4349 domain-containing protein [Sphingobacterium bovistauri]
MKRYFIYTGVLAALLMSCNHSSENKNNIPETLATTEEYVADGVSNINSDKILLSSESNEAPSSPVANNSNTNLDKQSLKTIKIIRNGNLSVESKDIKKTKQRLDDFIKKVEGYYEQETTSAGSTYTNLNLIVRIPSEKFDSFITSIEKGDDKLTNKSIKTEDVSLQYYDVESRIKSKRTYLEHYQKMVSSAKSVEDLLKIQEQIRQLQEDIESNESLFKNLANQISYSTIAIDIFHSESGGSVYSETLFSQIKDSFIAGWNLIREIFLGIITIWPIILIAISLIIGWKKYKKKRINK